MKRVAGDEVRQVGREMADHLGPSGLFEGNLAFTPCETGSGCTSYEQRIWM